jgi:hypothetical protein
MGVLHIVLHPLQCSLVMVNAIIIISIVQLSVVQKARLGVAAAEVAMPVIHITEACGAAIVRARAHVSVVSLTATQDTAAPLGALFIDMVSAILLALTAVEPPLALTLPTIVCMFVVPLLGYTSNGGIINEGGTDSTTITPCCSSNVAVAGTVVVTSLVTSLNGVINMATIVCGGICAGGGGRDSACGG